MIKRLYPVVFIFLLAVPLVAQYTESTNAQPANIGGSWQLSWQGRGGAQQATIQLQQDGSNLSGTLQDSGGGSSQLTGSIAGNNVSFSVQIQGRRTITLAFTGTIDGDTMSGTVQPQGGGGGRGGRGRGQGNHSWSGVRQQGNSGRQSGPEQSQDGDDEYGL